jgi:hypothetical protein
VNNYEIEAGGSEYEKRKASVIARIQDPTQPEHHRYNNMRAIVARFGAANVARKIGVGNTVLSQHVGDAASSAITGNKARSWEAILGMPVMSMDRPGAAMHAKGVSMGDGRATVVSFEPGRAVSKTAQHRAAPTFASSREVVGRTEAPVINELLAVAMMSQRIYAQKGPTLPAEKFAKAAVYLVKQKGISGAEPTDAQIEEIVEMLR